MAMMRQGLRHPLSIPVQTESWNRTGTGMMQQETGSVRSVTGKTWRRRREPIPMDMTGCTA